MGMNVSRFILWLQDFPSQPRVAPSRTASHPSLQLGSWPWPALGAHIMDSGHPSAVPSKWDPVSFLIGSCVSVVSCASCSSCFCRFLKHRPPHYPATIELNLVKGLQFRSFPYPFVNYFLIVFKLNLFSIRI